MQHASIPIMQCAFLNPFHKNLKCYSSLVFSSGKPKTTCFLIVTQELAIMLAGAMNFSNNFLRRELKVIKLSHFMWPWQLRKYSISVPLQTPFSCYGWGAHTYLNSNRHRLSTIKMSIWSAFILLCRFLRQPGLVSEQLTQKCQDNACQWGLC